MLQTRNMIYRVEIMINFSKMAISLVILVSSSAPAYANYDWVITNAHVTVVEGSYAPDSIPFQIDASAGTCTAGSFLNWSSSGVDMAAKVAKYQANYASLIGALYTGRPIQIYGYNAGCVVEHIWAK